MKSVSKGWSIMLRYANPGWIHYGLIIEFCKGYLHARPAQRLLNPPTPPSLHFLHHTFFCTFGCTPGILASNMNHFHSPSSCLNCRQRAKKARIQYSANAELKFEGLSSMHSSLPPQPPYRSLHHPTDHISMQSLWNFFSADEISQTLGEICN